MPIDSAMARVYRYYANNPAARTKFSEETKGIADGVVDRIVDRIKGSATTSYNPNIEALDENTVYSNIVEKYLTLCFSSEHVSEAIKNSRGISQDISNLIISISTNAKDLQQKKDALKKTLCSDYFTQMRSVQEMKKSMRKAFRNDPQANNVAKELISDLRNSKNADSLSSLQSLFSSFTIGQSETATNAFLDMIKAVSVPKEIKADSIKLTTDANSNIQNLSVGTFANMLEHLVKKN